jgi:ribosomal protein S18 acetylase RimI-like enzyme
MKLEPLTLRHLPKLHDIILGYSASQKYSIEHQETTEEITFRLKLVSLPEAVAISYGGIDDEEMARYARLVGNGYCFVAVVDGQLAGVAIAEPQTWNQTLWVWDFHVAPAFQRQGVGRMLMEKLVETAVAHKLRALVCETQSHNVPAIRFYRSQGFTLEGIDLSYYTNEDYDPKQNVAVFMKRKISKDGV